LKDLDKAILETCQTTFPIELGPYEALGRRLGADAAEIHARVRAMLSNGVIRRLGPVFDSRRLGFSSTLAALAVDPGDVDSAAAVIEEYPQVTHNYERRGLYNVWFTVISETPERATEIVCEIAERSGARSSMELPATKVFKINVRFRVLEEKSPSRPAACARDKRPVEITPLARELIAATSTGLPGGVEPYAELASRLGVGAEQVVAEFRRLAECGVLRKMGAIADQRRLGLEGNVMCVWRVPPARLEEAGLAVAARPDVSHCYARATAPDWPYNLYAMVHMASAGECRKLGERIAREIGAEASDYLETVRELKKTPPVYFSESL
jgi:DNA-binding Lrp family transcriptional regulator